MPAHHPNPEDLMEYAAGSQHEPLALLIATHLALCPECRRELRRLEALGGELIEELPAEPMSAGALDRLLARLEAPEAASPASSRAPSPSGRTDELLPQPLRGYVGKSLDRLAWHARGGVAEAELLPDFPGYKTRLLRIRPGTVLPTHTHKGNEYTIVLAGGFSDQDGHYLRGDVAVADSTVTHRPVADPVGECLCLAVTDGPLRLTGPVGRLLNFFVRI